MFPDGRIYCEHTVNFSALFLLFILPPLESYTYKYGVVEGFRLALTYPRVYYLITNAYIFLKN